MKPHRSAAGKLFHEIAAFKECVVRLGLRILIVLVSTGLPKQLTLGQPFLAVPDVVAAIDTRKSACGQIGGRDPIAPARVVSSACGPRLCKLRQVLVSSRHAPERCASGPSCRSRKHHRSLNLILARVSSFVPLTHFDRALTIDG